MNLLIPVILLLSNAALEAQTGGGFTVRGKQGATAVPVKANEKYCHPKLTLARRGDEVPPGPDCPDPPRYPSPDKPIDVSLLLERLQVTSPADLAFELFRPRGSPVLTSVVLAIFGKGKKLLTRQACDCGDQISKVKAGEAMVLTLSDAAVTAMTPHFKEGNLLVIYTGFGGKSLPQSSVLVMRK